MISDGEDRQIFRQVNRATLGDRSAMQLMEAAQ